MVAFSIATLNVDGIRDDDKRARIFKYLRSLNYDFYLLQETLSVLSFRLRISRRGLPAGGGGGLTSGILVATSPGV